MFGWLNLQGPRRVVAVVNQPLTAAAHMTASVICQTAFKLSFKLSSVALSALVVGWCVNMVLLCSIYSEVVMLFLYVNIDGIYK